MTDQRRRQRKIDKQREIEARWLQKLLFALSKAKEARAKLTETTGEDLNPLVTLDDAPNCCSTTSRMWCTSESMR